jgi:[protein-PII] uridylyltransferase
VVGESLAVQVGRRLGFAEPDVVVLGAMVRHHLLLPHTATRRDLDDPATVTRVVETLVDAVDDGAPGTGGLLLDLLTALAEADSLATGPGVWSPWKKTLIGDLARRCRALMAGEPLPAPPDDSDQEMAAAVLADQRPQVRFADEDTPATVVVAVPAARGSLSAAAGVLALHSLEVHAAELSTTGEVAVFRFTVSPRFGGLPDPALLRTDLGRVVDGTLVLADALARKERDYAPTNSSEPPAPPRVLWFDDEATGAVVLELRGTDRIGLLHRVAAALEGCDAELRWARVATLGSSVVDSFSLAGPNGDGAIRTADRRRIEQAVIAAVG